MSHYMPIITETIGRVERSMDLYSRMLRERTIFLNSEVDDQSSNLLICQLLFLEAENPNLPIYMYVNSPGGVCSSGLAVISCMSYISSPISTVVTAQAASMASLIASSGTKGMRKMLKYSTHLVHQPLGGARGQASDMQIQINEILRLKQQLTDIYVENTGQSYSDMEKMMDRDTILTAEECIKYGLADEILIKR